MKIALLGRLRSGKTTAMNMMIDIAKNDYNIDLAPMPLAKPIYDEAISFYERNGLLWRKNRRLLEGLGEAFNSDYPHGDKLVEIFDINFHEYMAVIVEDTRRITQADYFVDMKFNLIRINASEEIRKSRCKPGEFTSGHITDIELDNYPVNFEISNESTLEELRRNCQVIVDTIRQAELDLQFSRF